MAVTSYYSVEGQILGESTGGVRTDYAPDALGSVMATVDQGSSVVNQYSYKPYGSQLSKSGAGADPSFRWVGSLGYRHTGRSKSESYVRARHYDQKGGRWTSVDPLWPRDQAFNYGLSCPTTNIDPSGLWSAKINCSGSYTIHAKKRTDKQDVSEALDRICNTAKNLRDRVDECMNEYCPDQPASANRSSCFDDFCTGKLQIQIDCIGRFGGRGNCASDRSKDCAQTSGYTITLCGASLGSKGPPAPSKKCRPLECVLMHEIIHTCGFVHPGDNIGIPVNPQEDCQCFNCTSMLFPYCDGFYVDPTTGKRKKFSECCNT